MKPKMRKYALYLALAWILMTDGSSLAAILPQILEMLKGSAI